MVSHTKHNHKILMKVLLQQQMLPVLWLATGKLASRTLPSELRIL